MLRPATASLFALLLACDSGNTEPPAAESAPPAATAEKTEPAAPQLDKAALEQQARDVILVPSPTEMQNALAQAGIAEGLSALVPDKAPNMAVEDRDVISVRTGTVLAYALLTVKDAPNEALTARLEHVKAGMSALGAGTDIAATIDDIVGRINAGSLSRDDLLGELDELHGAVIPEIEYEAGDKVVPLIKAGSWLAGVNLVAEAVVKAGNAEAGTKLLRQPEVADYFLEYVKTEGADKAPAEVMTALQQTLTRLKELSSKPELTLDEVKEIHTQTSGVLALL